MGAWATPPPPSEGAATVSIAPSGDILRDTGYEWRRHETPRTPCLIPLWKYATMPQRDYRHLRTEISFTALFVAAVTVSEGNICKRSNSHEIRLRERLSEKGRRHPQSLPPLQYVDHSPSSTPRIGPLIFIRGNHVMSMPHLGNVQLTFKYSCGFLKYLPETVVSIRDGVRKRLSSNLALHGSPGACIVFGYPDLLCMAIRSELSDSDIDKDSEWLATIIQITHLTRLPLPLIYIPHS